MVNAIVFSSFASAEIERSFNWYENSSSGLGVRFVNVLDDAFALLDRNPLAFPKTKHNYREMVLTTFPYLIIYEYQSISKSIYILHVFHTSRNPRHKYKSK